MKSRSLDQDIDACRRRFKDFVLGEISNKTYRSNFLHLIEHDKNQLDRWLRSARIAHGLREDHDFKVSPPDKLVAVVTPQGIRHTRVVRPLSGGRIAEGKYAHGVHQCLCARMNAKYGSAGTHVDPFYIPPENGIMYTSGATSLLDTYHCVYAVTGTPGTKKERQEVEKKQGMHFIDVPRELPLQRQDKKAWLAKDADQQREFLVEEIQQALKKEGGSVLLICEDDQESHRILTQLQALHFEDVNWQHVHADTVSEEEQAAIEKAGIPRTITVSTKMLGRGTDIQADNLIVLGTYLPSKREEEQLFGRSGRFGKGGAARLILDKKRSKELPITYHHGHAVATLQRERQVQEAQQRTLTEMLVGFRDCIEMKFFRGIKREKFPPELLTQWLKYLEDLDEDWVNVRKTLLEVSDEETLTDRFSEFVVRWEGRVPVATHCAESLTEEEKSPATQAIESFQRSLSIFSEMKDDSVEEQRPLLEARDDYDPVNDGQARISNFPFADEWAVLTGKRSPFADTRAWWEGRGVLFPNVRATWAGDRPIFADLRAFIWRLIERLRVWWEEGPVMASPAPAA